MSLLEIKKLHFHYDSAIGRLEVLRDINLSVNRGDFLCIQGPSGSGKSTLFYVIGCLLRPTSGSITVDGRDITHISEFDLAILRNKTIGFVFQQFHLLPRANILENIALSARYPIEMRSVSKSDLDRARSLAKQLDIENLLEKRPNQLSGGQQQRVAIARALMNDADIILADEPTGNLDSKTAEQVMSLLKQLNEQGKTIVMITHDAHVATYAQRRCLLRDGVLTEQGTSAQKEGEAKTIPLLKKKENAASPLTQDIRIARTSLRHAFANLMRNKSQTLLTTLGIIIGVAAVLGMISLGQFTKARLLEGYEALGVNKLVIRGHRNWWMRASKSIGVSFDGFNWEKDIQPLPRIFPEIKRMSPSVTLWGTEVTYGGRKLSEGAMAVGVTHEYFSIVNTKITSGRTMSPYHVENRTGVCWIGPEIVKQLAIENPVGKAIGITFQSKTGFTCKVMGVLESKRSNNEWRDPDKQVILPFTFIQAMIEQRQGRIQEVNITVSDSKFVEETGVSIRAFFEKKYGDSGMFRVDSDSTLVAQMRRFLNIFSILLAGVAFLSLLVGGIGIHNMMLVSVTERIKEIGLRKALGATNRSIRALVLTESLMICSMGGLIGIAFGLGSCGAMMYAATKFVKDLKFEWVIDPIALIAATLSILIVGILSGMAPALRAEKLQVIEALRAE